MAKQNASQKFNSNYIMMINYLIHLDTCTRTHTMGPRLRKMIFSLAQAMFPYLDSSNRRSE